MEGNAGVQFLITPKTKYILSTSGRISSLARYQRLLQELLKIDVVYLPFHTGDEEHPIIDPERFVWALKGMPCIGGAISKDIKNGIVPFIDILDETAQKVQSVNTVIVEKENGRLIGYNTDVLGFRTAITQGVKRWNLTLKTAVCYGYGGVASVVVSVLQQLGIVVYLCGRNLGSASTRAKELRCEVWTSGLGPVDLFVNATPASEKPLNEATNLLESIASAKVAFDHEMPGRYLKDYCESNNILHIPGTDMYYPQMEIQWALFLQDYVDPKDIPNLIITANK